MLFAYEKYKTFLKHTKTIGRIVPLGEYDGSRTLILRHDIDLDIKPAYRLSRIESDCGVKSSYFFLLTSDTYNVFSAENKMMIRQMASDGFEIGLHFDPSVYPNADSQKLHNHVEKEIEILSDLAQCEVKSISLHNPSLSGEYPLFEGWLNAYDPEIFAPDRYLSDSRMEFQQDPYQFVEKLKIQTLQLLLHPMHFSETGNGYPDIFTEYLKDTSSRLDRIFSVNSTYKNTIGDSLYAFLKTPGG